MSRLVRHDAKGPAILEIAPGKFVELCQCGLSKNQPFCDDSHKKTRDEPDGALFVYDAEHNRVAIPDMYPPPAKRYNPPAD